MSWPGRALYAAAAVLVGGVFTAIPYFADAMDSWGREDRRLYGFLLTFTLAAAGGFLVQIVFAALLRWLTRMLGLRGAWHWIVAGAALGLAVPWGAAKLGYLLDRVYFTADLQQVKWFLLFPLQGSMMYVFQPLWVLLAVGAATGFVLRPIASRLSRMPADSRIRA